MNNIDKITDRILQDARAEAEAIHAEAETACAALRSEAETEAQGLYEQLCHRNRQESEMALERYEGALRLESGKELLAEKQALVETAFSNALKQLARLPEEEYKRLCVCLAVQSADGTETLLFNPADREKYGKAIVDEANSQLSQLGKAAHLTLSEETRELSGGLILCRDRIEINCSLDALLSIHRERLTAPVANLLFNE